MANDHPKLTGPYIPRPDVAKRNWFNNFASIVSQNPGAVGLTAADASYLTSLAQRYEEAFQLVQAPGTRTSPGIRAKDDIRKLATAEFRICAMQVKMNPNVDIDLRVRLGIHLDDGSLSRLGAPTSAPVLYIVSSGPLEHILRYADRETPTRRAKPKGAQRLELFVAITTGRPTGDPHKARYLRSYAKQPIRVQFDPKDGGKYASLFGRWATNTGAFGPWSVGVSLTIPWAGFEEGAAMKLAA